MKSFIVFVYVFMYFVITAQTEDAHLWTGAGVTSSLNNKVELGYKTQTRFYQNVSALRVYFNQARVSYKVTKGVKVSMDYRFSRKKKKYSYFATENRFTFNATYGYKIKQIGTKFTVRARYQTAFDRLKTVNNIPPNINNKLRIKFTARYKYKDFKRVQPYVSYEWFKTLSELQDEFSIAQRFYVGLFVDLPYKNELKIGYIYQKNSGEVIELRHIYMIQYTYSLGKLFNGE